MLSYPVPNNMLPHDVIVKTQRKRNSEDPEQVGSKEKEGAECNIVC